MLLTHAHPDHWFGLRHLGRSAVHAGPVTARFPEGYAARVVQERGADSAAPVIGGVELRYRLVTDTEAREMLLVEVPAAAALIGGTCSRIASMPSSPARSTTGSRRWTGWAGRP